MAASLSSFAGIKGVIAFDLATFLFAFSVLLFRIKIPENAGGTETGKKKEKISVQESWREGLQFLRGHKQLWYLMISMALMNFFSRLTYENILSPMILARSGQNQIALGIVSGILGIGGMAGGLIVSFVKLPKDSVRVIFLSGGISFLLGDFLMGAGQNILVWSIASLPIPFIMAGQNVILYRTIPQNMQGRIFAVRNAIQYWTIPTGILLGGFLADYVFEPFMCADGGIQTVLHRLTGYGAGSGMAVMFLCTGLLGSLSCFFCYKKMKKNG